MRLRFVLWALCVSFACAAHAQTIAIRAGNLIDPAKGTVAKDQIILVKSGNIDAVGPKPSALGKSDPRVLS